MGLLARIFGGHGTTTLSTPPLPLDIAWDPNKSIDQSPPRLRTVRTCPTACCSGRQSIDNFPKPKRSYSLPLALETGSRLDIRRFLGIPPASVKVPEARSRDSKEDMEDIRELLDNDPMNLLRDDEWFPLNYSTELLDSKDIALEAILRKTKKDHPEWKWSSTTSDLASFVRRKAPKLFTMLVYHHAEKMLDQFCGQGMNDSMFPVKLIRSTCTFCIESTNIHKPKSLEFPPRFAKDVVKWQWEFFLPELRWTEFDHPSLDPASKLPFLEPLKEVSYTDFSIVCKGIVHRDHIDISEYKGSPGYTTSKYKGIELMTNKEDHPYVAVKRLLPTALKPEDVKSFIQAEYETLNILRRHDHPHLIKAIAFYKQRIGTSEAIHFIFPWAEYGNLRQFWQQKTPSINDDYMRWFFDQLVGLADAIYILHHEDDNSCRHGDLKPENVLCFNTVKSGQRSKKDQTSCILVITDVGLSRVHDKSTEFRSRTRQIAGETVTYAAPETALFPDQATSRRYDIWSLGCLYLEFVIWVLYGIRGLNRFKEEMKNSAETKFYVITTSSSLTVTGGKSAKLNPLVTTWIEHIKHDPRCIQTGSTKTALSELINLIEKRLLVVTATPDSRDLKIKGQDQVTVDNGKRTDIPMFNLRRPTTLNDMTEHKSSSLRKYSDTGKERAYALEVLEKLSKIVKDGNTHSTKWINIDGPRASPVDGPKPRAKFAMRSREEPVGKNRDCLIDFSDQKLDDTWEYIPDEVAAERLETILNKLPRLATPSELCERCSTLALWSQQCTFGDTATDLALKSHLCALCRLLSSALKAWEILPDDILHFFRSGSYLKFNSERLLPIASLYTIPSSSDDLKANVQLGFPKLPHPGSLEHVEVLRQWIQDCDNTHQCLQSQGTPFLPTRLLYVGKQGLEQPRLICNTQELSKDTKYMALSHRWGSHPKDGEVDPLAGKYVCTYNRNFDTITHGIDESLLPAMYLDAIKTARDLNVDYIWIDSLCIIQRDMSDPSDDGEDWKAESERMEQVYRSAYLTIAASCSGSPGERFLSIRPERQCVSMKMDDTSYYVCEPVDDFRKDVEQGELNKRGWVLQERALSRRTIYFTEKQAYWECGQGVRCETLTKTKNSKASFLGDANFPYSIPNYVKGKKIVLYQDLYERYSKLALSFNTDRPIAIRGLEKRLATALQSKARFGIFDIYLRRGLLWQRDKGTLERIDFPNNLEQVRVPSWSWMAYAGGIRYMNVPLGGVEWDEWEGDLVHEWKESGVLELEVLVRDVKDVKTGGMIFRDEPGRELEGSFGCVVLGSSNAANLSKGMVFYVLIVVKVVGHEGEREGFGDGERERERKGSVYERVGVACLHRGHIEWEDVVKSGWLR